MLEKIFVFGIMRNDEARDRRKLNNDDIDDTQSLLNF